MAKSLIVASYGLNTSYLASTSNYLNLGHGFSVINNSVENNSRTYLRVGGTFSRLYIKIPSNGTTATSTYLLRKNAVNGTLTISIGAGATGEFTDTTHSDSFVSGDRLSTRLIVGAGGGIYPSVASVVFEPNVESGKALSGSSNDAGTSAASTTVYHKLFSARASTGTTEASVKQRVFVPCTIRHFQVYISSNARTTSTTVGVRKNGSNGNSTLSIAGAATGIFYDSVNTDSLAANDLVNAFITTGTGTQFFSPSGIFFTQEATTGEEHCFIGGNLTGTSYSANTTKYESLSGNLAASSSDDITSVDIPLPGRLKGLGINVLTNTVSASSTLRTRINGANGAQSLSIGSTATGFFEDSSNSDTIAAGDNANLQLVTGATGTAMTVAYMRTVLAFASTKPAITKSLAYTVLTTPAAKTKSLSYEVRAIVSMTKALTYNVEYTPAAIDKTLSYEVVTSASSSKTLAYKVAATPIVTKSLGYCLISPQAIQKTLEYTMFFQESVDVFGSVSAESFTSEVGAVQMDGLASFESFGGSSASNEPILADTWMV